MADEEKEENQPELSPEELLTKMEKRIGVNKILMISALVLSGILVSVMGTGITVMAMRISALNEAAVAQENSPMDEQFQVLEQQIMLLADFRKSELRKITNYTKQMEKISKDCNLEKAAPYNNFLSSRESDFKRLVETIKSGTGDLAAMNRGSKKWLTAYNTTLDELVANSVARKAVLEREVGSGS